MNVKEKLTQLTALEVAIHEHFGFQQGSHPYTLNDATEDYWFVSDFTLHFSDTPFTEGADSEGKYQEDIMGDVKRAGGYVAIPVRYSTGDNYLMILDESKEFRSR